MLVTLLFTQVQAKYLFMALATAQAPYIDHTWIAWNNSYFEKEVTTKQLNVWKDRLAELWVVIPNTTGSILKEPNEIADKTKSDLDLMKTALNQAGKNSIQIKDWVLVADNSNKSMVEQQKFIEEMTNLLKNTDTFKSFDKDDQKWFLEYIKEEGILSSYNRTAFTKLLDSEWFTKKEKKSLLANFPDLYAWASKITTEELENLAKLSFRDVINNYIKTWEIPKWFEVFEDDLKEIKAIIKEKQAIIRKWKELDKKEKELNKKWKELDKKWKVLDIDIMKTKEIKDRIDWIIKKMKEMKKNSH